MLVLSRKKNEEIIIGDNITVKVLGVNSDGSVKLGIEAPKEVRVDRSEVRMRKAEGQFIYL